MEFKFNIQPTAAIQKGYNPSSIKIWIGSTETVEIDGQPVDVINVQTETYETLENGTRIESRHFKFPTAMLQPAFSNFNMVTGQPDINPAVVNQILAQYDLIII